MSKTYTNSGKSVKERLLNLSRAEHYNPQMMISRYMQERLLYRLSISNYRERFILKGGALLYAHDRFEARPTLDIDFSPKIKVLPLKALHPLNTMGISITN